MLIDWFTVGAQIVNFLVLVWLLKRFAYERIMRAVDAREKRIADRLAEAAAREAQACEYLARAEAKLAEFERQRESMLADAKADAEQQHASMLEDARKRIRVVEEKWRDDVDRDRQTFLENLRHRVAAEIFSVVRRVIAELTSKELEQCAIQLFLQKIRSLTDAEWHRFGTGELCIRSPLQLPSEQRDELRQTIEAQLGRTVELRFEQTLAPGLGVELRGNGWRIDWSSESYLQEMEEELNEALNETGGTGAAAQATR
jgi:F-type H+-transporting ATPase subunit b